MITYDQQKFQYLKSDSEFFYAFDSNGNLIRKTSVDDPNRLQEEFIYSSENQLITYRRIEAGIIIAESNYAYDALGRRLEKKVVYPDNSSKDFIRRFMYDGGEIVTEVDGTNQVLANYTHSNLRTDDVLSVQITAEGKTRGLAKSQGNYFYLKDSLGTITDITDGSGNLIQHFVYSPFGEIIRVTNKLNEDISSDWMIRTSYTFTNREYDEESGLYYYRARYYDASTGRFLQVDPDPGKLSMPSTHVNKYIYVGNNPFNLADPSGMSWLKNAWRGAEKWVGDHKKEITITAIIVASALTGGAAAGALATGFWSGLAIGAGAGAITGGIIGGLGAKWQGKSFASGLVQGAIIGAVAGGIAGGYVGYAKGAAGAGEAMPGTLEDSVSTNMSATERMQIEYELNSSANSWLSWENAVRFAKCGAAIAGTAGGFGVAAYALMGLTLPGAIAGITLALATTVYVAPLAQGCLW